MSKIRQDLNRVLTTSELQYTTPNVLGKETHSSELDFLYGWYDSIGLDSGLSLHVSKTKDLSSDVTQAVSKAGVKLKIFLKGQVEASLGETPIQTARRDQRTNEWIPVVSLFSQTKEEIFTRRSSKGNNVEKVSFLIDQEWLEEAFSETSHLSYLFETFAKTHLNFKTWIPSRQTVASCQMLLKISSKSGFLAQLQKQNCAYQILVDCLEHAFCRTMVPALGELSSFDKKCLNLINEYLDAHKTDPINMETLTNLVGMSETSLRRVLRRTHGMSVIYYVRKYKLEWAKREIIENRICIDEAAYLSGYSSAANFATAFKRVYGICPSELRTRYALGSIDRFAN